MTGQDRVALLIGRFVIENQHLLAELVEARALLADAEKLREHLVKLEAEPKS